MWPRGKARIGVWGKALLLADKLKVLAHVYIILCTFALCKISLQVKGEHGSNGPMVNTLMPSGPIHSSFLPLHHCVLPSFLASDT